MLAVPRAVRMRPALTNIITTDSAKISATMNPTIRAVSVAANHFTILLLVLESNLFRLNQNTGTMGIARYTSPMREPAVRPAIRAANSGCDGP